LNNSNALLICHLSSEIGVGHLSRLLALAQNLSEEGKVTPQFLIFGDFIKRNELESFKVYSFSLEASFVDTIQNILKIDSFDVLIFDIFPRINIPNLDNLFIQLKRRQLILIGIDSLVDYCNILDLIWIPSFSFDCQKHTNCKSLLRSGWDSFLIQKRLQHKDWTPGSKVLILTGGSDAWNLGKTLPIQLDNLLSIGTSVNWVKGPFSMAPILPKKCRLNWTISNSPEQLDELIVQSNYIMTLFGVTFFEVLQYGIPTVVFSPNGDKDNIELNALSKEGVALVENNPQHAINGLFKLMNNRKLAEKYSKKSLKKMSMSGVKNLSNEIYSLMRLK